MLGGHRITHDEHPRLPYRRREVEEKSGLMQCGNLKLFCSELAFLTKCASSGDVLVYVGGKLPPFPDHG